MSKTRPISRNSEIVAEGAVLEAPQEQVVSGVVHWRAPLTTGFTGVLPQGTRIEVMDAPLADSTAVYCRPLDYAEAEVLLIPRGMRTSKKYDGYSIVLPLEEVNRTWKQVDV